ncbi:MAG TPA: hypothetical protein VGB42_08360 [Candidatus Thermoplasmatota archaeon]
MDPIERMRAYFRERAATTGRKVDVYLTQNLHRLAKEYELATTNDLKPVDDRLAEQWASVEDLEKWGFDARERVDAAARRVSRLEMGGPAGGA